MTRLLSLHRTRAYWQNQEVADERVSEELLALLRERALSSIYVQWALIEPVRIYCNVLEAYLEGIEPSALGRLMREALVSWAPEFPLDHIWASLPAQQLEEELKTLEAGLLQHEDSKARFRRRLADRFGDITAVKTVLAHLAAPTGEVQ